MELPKAREMFTNILEVLKDGKILHYREVGVLVRDNFYSHLSDDLLNKKTKTGVNVLLDRVGWGASYLKWESFALPGTWKSANYGKRKSRFAKRTGIRGVDGRPRLSSARRRPKTKETNNKRGKLGRGFERDVSARIN